MKSFFSFFVCRFCLSAALIATATATITLDMIAIGNAGNTADTTTYGSVAYAYNIGKTEVTTAQYVAFLNATTSTVDTYGLYNVGMATMGGIGVGISQTGGVITNFSYTVTGGWENRPKQAGGQGQEVDPRGSRHKLRVRFQALDAWRRRVRHLQLNNETTTRS